MQIRAISRILSLLQLLSWILPHFQTFHLCLGTQALLAFLLLYFLPLWLEKGKKG